MLEVQLKGNRAGVYDLRTDFTSRYRPCRLPSIRWPGEYVTALQKKLGISRRQIYRNR